MSQSNRCQCGRFKSPDVSRCPLCILIQQDKQSDPAPEPSTLFDDNWKTFNAFIGRTVEAATFERANRSVTDKLNGKRVILHLSDLHIPHLDEKALAAALAANLDADTCVVGGDIFNAGSVSLKYSDREFSDPRNEIEQTTRVLQMLAKRFRVVHIKPGNHVERIRKFFQAKLPSYLLFLCQTDPLAYIVRGLRSEGITNIVLDEPAIEGLPSSNWLTVIGDCAFTHAEAHGKLQTRPAENAAKWLRKWSRKLKTVPRVIVQEHNHRGGKSPDQELGMLLIQCPALSHDQDYQVDPNLKYSPNQIGYVRIVQYDGITDWNESDYKLLSY